MAHVTDFKEAGFNTLLEELEWRGLISQSTDRDRLAEALNGEPITYYCGFDPTAASLHIGNLVQLINMRHLQLAGHHPIALVGGATGLIGAPRQSGERTLNPKDVVAGWADRLKNQIGGILDTEGANAVRFVSNYDWTASMTVIDFLRDVGKNFRLGTMLAKDTVARRLNSEEGISFTEFSYQVLQGNDFLHLFDEYHCTLELGGSDQWGNLTSGLDLIHKVRGVDVNVFTSPIITDASGKKFGKSEGNAVWLDATMLSPYKFYQFWLNVSDEDAKRYIKIFTLLDKQTIDDLIAEHDAAPHLRILQKRLAQEVTVMIHSQEEYEKAVEASNILFGGATSEALRKLDEQTLLQVFEGVPQYKIARAELIGLPFIELCAERSDIFPSKGECRKMVQAGGVSLNKEKVADPMRAIAESDLIDGKYLLVQKGKKNYYLVIAE